MEGDERSILNGVPYIGPGARDSGTPDPLSRAKLPLRGLGHCHVLIRRDPTAARTIRADTYAFVCAGAELSSTRAGRAQCGVT